MKLVNEVKFAGEHNKHAVLPYLKIDLDGSIHSVAFYSALNGTHYAGISRFCLHYSNGSCFMERYRYQLLFFA